MNIERFGTFKTGTVVPIETLRRQDWAFVPNPLPPASWNMSASLWQLIAEARQAIGDLNGSGSNLSNPRLLLRPLQRREALRSSSLEGTYASPRELLLFEKAMRSEDVDSQNAENSWREVHNCYLALRTGYRQIRQGHSLNQSFICSLHKILMHGVRGEEKTPGLLRESQVHVGVDWRYNPPPPSEMKDCLVQLESYLANNVDHDPLVKAFLAHYQFEAIHPFTDGNGRIGRVLLSLTIARWLSLSHPWLYMSEFFENHRSDYISMLFRVSTDGECDEWVEFCAKGAIEQARLSVERCKKLEALKRNYMAMVEHGGHSHRLYRIIDMLFKSQVVYVTEARDRLRVSYQTAKGDLMTLEELGIVIEAENEYPKMYIADAILNIAYLE